MSPTARYTRLSGRCHTITCGMLLLACFASPAVSAHLLNMTEARLQLDPDTHSGTLKLQIDLLRSVGSTQAYLALAQDIDNSAYDSIWTALSQAIYLQQGQQRINLTFQSAAPPSPLIAEAFSNPLQWPRVWVTLVTDQYNPQLPLQITFSSAFIFEEPVAITISEGDTRMSRWLIANQPSPVFVGPAASNTEPTPDKSWLAVLQPYLNSLQTGFLHILPAGIDHLMFVLAMLLTCRTVRQTVILVTAFTVGHSLSLAIAGFKLVTIPSLIVEPLILLSISLYALQALRHKGSQPNYQFVLVLGIGLVHGLGFAAAFSQLQWTHSPALHLFAFNLGIELAQLIFVGAAYPLLKRFELHHAIARLLILAPMVYLAIVLLQS